MKVGDRVVCITNDPSYDAYCKRGDFGKVIYLAPENVDVKWALCGFNQIVMEADVAPFSILRVISELLKRDKKVRRDG